ncbi:MAG: coenzyme F420-0:L-glutamate ligase [Candidatus Bathyarchaeota archaeon]|nr:coenzyme F420-0:L-glutamate ligase [Candidatus Bathyarchaeota archaeon]
MKLIPIKMPLIQKGDDIIAIFLNVLHDKGLKLEDGDIVTFADKIAAISEGRVINFEYVEPSEEAKALAERYVLEPGFVEVVLREADEIFGGVIRALLTVKNDIIIANAGMDHKNAPVHSATMWPSNPNDTAAKLRGKLERTTGKRVGVLLVDSHVAPMRMGTLGFALGIAGFRPVKDCRGMKDLYGKPLRITRINLADDLASAAHLVMGETTERIAIAIIRNSNVTITDDYDPREVVIPKEECLFMKNLGKDRYTP